MTAEKVPCVACGEQHADGWCAVAPNVCCCCGREGARPWADGRLWHEDCLRNSRAAWPECHVCGEPVSPRDAKAADGRPLSESRVLVHRDADTCTRAALVALELVGLWETEPEEPMGFIGGVTPVRR